MPKKKVFRTPNELAVWLYKQLDATEPRVCVDPSVFSSVRGMLRELKKGEDVYARSAYYSEVMIHIVWVDPPEGAPRCGVKALMFLGELTQAADKYELSKIPTARAVQLLMDFYSGDGLQLQSREGRYRVVSNPEFEKRWGFGVRVRLDSLSRHVERAWQLDDLRDGG
jgi:hypothetical protein